MYLDGTIKVFRVRPKDLAPETWTYAHASVRLYRHNGDWSVERAQTDEDGTYWKHVKRHRDNERAARADYRAGIEEVQQAYPDYEAY